MKRTLIALILMIATVLYPAVTASADSGQSAFDVLPIPEPNPDSDFGVDINVNMGTIDSYLNLADAVYRDMRMPVDPYDYDAIGGSSIASATIEGFAMVPYPKLAPCLGMPEELGDGYAGPTLFSVDEDGAYQPNYAESMAIMERLFPKDSAILLMCGAGGYAGMTKNLLTALGWDENLIINVGGYWDYSGEHSVPLLSEDSGDGLYGFIGGEIFDLDFTHLTPMQ